MEGAGLLLSVHILLFRTVCRLDQQYVCCVFVCVSVGATPLKAAASLHSLLLQHPVVLLLLLYFPPLHLLPLSLSNRCITLPLFLCLSVRVRSSSAAHKFSV